MRETTQCSSLWVSFISCNIMISRCIHFPAEDPSLSSGTILEDYQPCDHFTIPTLVDFLAAKDGNQTLSWNLFFLCLLWQPTWIPCLLVWHLHCSAPWATSSKMFYTSLEDFVIFRASTHSADDFILPYHFQCLLWANGSCTAAPMPPCNLSVSQIACQKPHRWSNGHSKPGMASLFKPFIKSHL